MNENYDNSRLSNARPLLWAYIFSMAFWILSVGTFWGPLRELLELALHDNLYSHIVVIPFISVCLIYWKRREVFSATAYQPKVGIPLLMAGLAACWWVSTRLLPARNNYRLSFLVLVVLFACAAGFLLLYGLRALRAARFPLLFLLLMIPIPRVLMERLILVLQVGTSDVLYTLFTLAGTTLYRNGLTFELPGGSIVIGRESSSIHSLWALFIVSLLLGHFLLNSLPAKVCLSLLTIPIAIFTNAVRILTIWFLARYISGSFLYGDLRLHGGVLFSFLSVCNLLLCLWILRKLDSAAGGAGDSAAPVPPVSNMLSDWMEMPSLTSFSCELTCGKPVSYRSSAGPAHEVVGLLERASGQEAKSLRVFVRRGDLAFHPEHGDQVTIDQIAYTVSAVQEEPGGTWLSLRAG